MPAARDAPQRTTQRQLDVVVDATRVVGGLIASTLAQAEPHVSMPQWRVLVLAADGGCPVSAVADDLAIHPSNATRIVDRLAAAGLVARQRGERDRRQVLVTLTATGRALFDDAMALRRGRVQRALRAMDPEQRERLVVSLAAFADAVRREPGPGPSRGPGPG